MPVEQSLADWGLHVPTLTPVVEVASHAHFLHFKNRIDFPWLWRSCHPLRPSSPQINHPIHKYQDDIQWISILLCSFHGTPLVAVKLGILCAFNSIIYSYLDAAHCPCCRPPPHCCHPLPLLIVLLPPPLRLSSPPSSSLFWFAITS